MNIDYQLIHHYYEDKLRAYGPTAQGMDWKNTDTQYLRFENIIKYIDFSNVPSILDVGCGAAELNNMLKTRSLNCVYHGLDLVQNMVDAVNTRFGEGTAFQGNLLEMEMVGKYDYVVASGTFNAKLNNDEDDWRIFFFKNLEMMFKCCNRAIIFNCMSQFVEWRYERLYYVNINDFSNYIVNNLSRKFVLDHSYPLFECTFVVYK